MNRLLLISVIKLVVVNVIGSICDYSVSWLCLL